MNDGDKPHYGEGTAAGHKGKSEQTRETGREAAAEITKTLPRRHRQMLDAWRPYGAAGAIPEVIANDLDLPVHVVRPRAGEMVRRGILYQLDKRPGGLGCNVTAYSVCDPDKAA